MLDFANTDCSCQVCAEELAGAKSEALEKQAHKEFGKLLSDLTLLTFGQLTPPLPQP